MTTQSDGMSSMSTQKLRWPATLLGLLLVSGTALAQEKVAQEPETMPPAEAPPPEAEHPTAGPALTIPHKDLRDSQQVITGSELADAAFPGSWPMFGTNYRLKLGGYAKVDFLYDVDGTIDRYQFLVVTIPVEGTPEHADRGYFSAFSRETRFNIDVRRVEAGRPPLRLFLEGDFWATGSQFRLRHAYIVVGDFLFGQTWTTVSVLESMVFIIDFGGGDVLFGGRSTQARFQHKFGDHWKLTVGLEVLTSMGIDNSSDLPGKPNPGTPLLAARGDYTWKSGLAVVAGSVAQLRWDGGATGPDADALQYDLVFAGRQYLSRDDYVTWNLSYGEGSGEHIMAFDGSLANAVLTPDGRLDTLRAFAAVAGYMHRWTATISSNFFYAYGKLGAPASRSPLALKEGQTAHANLVWRPVGELSFGLEYMWGRRRTADDSVGTAQRVQAMAKYEF